MGFEVSWSRQESAITIGTAAGSADLFDMNAQPAARQLRLSVRRGGRAAPPFVLAGAGATFLSADDLESETKFSWSVGAGLKWFPSKRVGARLQARYAPTMLNDTSSDFCDPFGFCQGSLKQFELTGGLVLRF